MYYSKHFINTSLRYIHPAHVLIMYTFNFLTFYSLQFPCSTALHNLYCVVSVVCWITCFLSVLNIFYLHHVLYLYEVIYIPVHSKLLALVYSKPDGHWPYSKFSKDFISCCHT